MACHFYSKCWNFSGNARGREEVKSAVLSNLSSPGFTEQKQTRKTWSQFKGAAEQIAFTCGPSCSICCCHCGFRCLCLLLTQWTPLGRHLCLHALFILESSVPSLGPSTQDARHWGWAYVLVWVGKSPCGPVCLLNLLIAASFTLQSDPIWIKSSFVNLSIRHRTTLWLT